MELTTERLENDAVLLLLQEDIPINPLAAENLFTVIERQLINLGSIELERKHIDQSVKAGRTVMTFIGAVA